MKLGRSCFLLLLGSILVTAPSALFAGINSDVIEGPSKLEAGDGGAGGGDSSGGGGSDTERLGEHDDVTTYTPEPDTEAAPDEDIEIRPLTEEDYEAIEWEVEQMRPPLPDPDEPVEVELPEKDPIPEVESGEGGAQNDKRGIWRAFARLFRRPA